MSTERLTVAQALVRFLAAQRIQRDGRRHHFFAGCLGIFGHGNVAGLGQALQQHHDLLPYHPARNEQAMVHLASGYARQRNRLGAFACTSSVGPGATNMVTGAALATVNRLPVLLLPGDTFASRAPHPVLQQLEASHDGTVSVNDCFRPVCRFFDRVNRPEQIVDAALAAMRVLTDPAETGAVCLALPEDVQTEVVEVPSAFLPSGRGPSTAGRRRPTRWPARRRSSAAPGARSWWPAAAWSTRRRPRALRAFCEATGIPVGETQAGRGALPSDHPSALGAIGATGTPAANRLAREADVVIGVGTRWSDFTTASKSAFQDPGVRFVNVNVAALDAAKHSGLALEADARLALDALREALEGWHADRAWEERAAREAREWGEEVARLYGAGHAPLPSQAEVIGAVNEAAGERDVVVCAAGSMPGDLHKLWRATDPDGKGYHVEYGYSCMGYELPGAMGVKLAAPDREVFAMVGDGSYLMLPGELPTAVAERIKLIVVLVQNHGYASIGALSRSVGGGGYGTHYRVAENGSLPVDDGRAYEAVPVDLAANAESLGARVIRARTVAELRAGAGRGQGARGRPGGRARRDRPLRGRAQL